MYIYIYIYMCFLFIVAKSENLIFFNRYVLIIKTYRRKTYYHSLFLAAQVVQCFGHFIHSCLCDVVFLVYHRSKTKKQTVCGAIRFFVCVCAMAGTVFSRKQVKENQNFKRNVEESLLYVSKFIISFFRYFCFRLLQLLLICLYLVFCCNDIGKLKSLSVLLLLI